jgi:hypothetical protein
MIPLIEGAVIPAGTLVAEIEHPSSRNCRTSIWLRSLMG